MSILLEPEDKKDSNFSTKHSEREPDINTGIYIKKKKIQSCYLMSGFPTPNIYSEDTPAIEKVSLDDINRAKNRYLKPERYSFTLLIPEELSENDVSEKIKKIFEKNVSEKTVSQETFQLKNGIKLSVYKKGSTNVFSINIASLAGSR
ncbi:MAG: hypothetical protein N3F66_15235, partial [Spirochaetes bacterium]|nr:hypothetical protein [Spirochaetota bacterium]